MQIRRVYCYVSGGTSLQHVTHAVEVTHSFPDVERFMLSFRPCPLLLGLGTLHSHLQLEGPYYAILHSKRERTAACYEVSRNTVPLVVNVNVVCQGPATVGMVEMRE